MRSVGFAVSAFFLGLLMACGGPAPSPQQTVALYLKRMSGDPMRVLPMLTDDFQRAHAMVFANVVSLSADFELDPDPVPNDPGYAAERGRLGWLMAPSLIDEVERMFAKRSQLELIWMGSRARGGRAAVGLRARVPGEAPVDFVFRLRRQSASARWRIDAVEMEGSSSPSAQFIRYLLSPNLECLRFIARAASARDRGPTGPRAP